jgi:predicted HicB family RNase H-like nuclease
VTFFREVLGVEGVVRRVFTNPEEMKAFEKTEEYSEIQGMVARLRAKSRNQTESNEPTRVITVRLPKSLHESLKAESHQRLMSMNQLCISKLLQIIDNDLVPSD